MNDMELPVAVLRTLGRSGRAKLLGQLLRIPGRKFTLNELAREAGVPLKTSQRAIKELQELGAANVERIGRTMAISANERSPLLRTIAGLRIKDPHVAAAEEFTRRVSKAEGVVACYLFGSVAGLRHKTGSDVDIAVIYDAAKTTRARLAKRAAEVATVISDSRRMVVVPVLLSSTELDSPTLDNRRLVEDILQGRLLWKKKGR